MKSQVTVSKEELDSELTKSKYQGELTNRFAEMAMIIFRGTVGRYGIREGSEHYEKTEYCFIKRLMKKWAVIGSHKNLHSYITGMVNYANLEQKRNYGYEIRANAAINGWIGDVYEGAMGEQSSSRGGGIGEICITELLAKQLPEFPNLSARKAYFVRLAEAVENRNEEEPMSVELMQEIIDQTNNQINQD